MSSRHVVITYLLLNEMIKGHGVKSKRANLYKICCKIISARFNKHCFMQLHTNCPPLFGVAMALWILQCQVMQSLLQTHTTVHLLFFIEAKCLSKHCVDFVLVLKALWFWCFEEQWDGYLNKVFSIIPRKSLEFKRWQNYMFGVLGRQQRFQNVRDLVFALLKQVLGKVLSYSGLSTLLQKCRFIKISIFA